MGCGHSKINIYPRRSKAKNSSKKSVTPEKAESEEEDGIENESENTENVEDCDAKKQIKVKPFGGPLLAQAEISTSQQDFFKMLDDKIENGPDYNSESESERAAERSRVRALLRDWEAATAGAGAGARSLPATPPRRRPSPARPLGSAQAQSLVGQPAGAAPGLGLTLASAQISQSVVHQSYGVTPTPYRQAPYNNPNYIGQGSPQALPSYPSAMQYQAISPLYTSQPTYQPPPRQYPSYNQYGSPIKSYSNPNISPKHIPYDQASYSPTHKLYGPPGQQFSNGELVQQQYQVQYQQYKEAREQVVLQNQQQQGYSRSTKSYQTSVTIPIVVKPSELNALHRKQYELT